MAKRKYTLEEKLMLKLMNIYDNENFVVGVCCILNSDEVIQKMIRFIEDRKGLTTDDIY